MAGPGSIGSSSRCRRRSFFRACLAGAHAAILRVRGVTPGIETDRLWPSGKEEVQRVDRIREIDAPTVEVTGRPAGRNPSSGEEKIQQKGRIRDIDRSAAIAVTSEKRVSIWSFIRFSYSRDTPSRSVRISSYSRKLASASSSS